MPETPVMHVLAAVPPASLPHYRETLSQDPQIKLSLVTEEADARAFLAQPQRRTDVLVLDNALGDAFTLIGELRPTYPRLIILLVDQGADFSTPGRADDVSVAPFEDDDLLKRIKRLFEERRLETLRADALPTVRAFAQELRHAGPGKGKPQAAVDAIRELGYDYVAYYSVAQAAPVSLSLAAQSGPKELLGGAPATVEDGGTLLGWVAENGQSRIAGPDDALNHVFIQERHAATGACVPVGTSLRFGVIFACRTQPSTITQQNVLMLELVSAQLAGALAKEDAS